MHHSEFSFLVFLLGMDHQPYASAATRIWSVFDLQGSEDHPFMPTEIRDKHPAGCYLDLPGGSSAIWGHLNYAFSQHHIIPPVTWRILMAFPSKNDHLDESICCFPKKNMIIMWKPWKTIERNMGKPWKTMEKTWENHGKPWKTIEQNMGKQMLKPMILWLILGWFPWDHHDFPKTSPCRAAWSHRALWPQGFDLGHAPGRKGKCHRTLRTCGANVAYSSVNDD